MDNRQFQWELLTYNMSKMYRHFKLIVIIALVYGVWCFISGSDREAHFQNLISYHYYSFSPSHYILNSYEKQLEEAKRIDSRRPEIYMAYARYYTYQRDILLGAKAGNYSFFLIVRESEYKWS